MPAVHVFTYGSLMCPDIFERVAGRLVPCCPAILSNWRRHALIDRTYPGAVQQTGHLIRGVLWQAVDDTALASLDAFESSEYQRIPVEASLDSGQVVAAQVYARLDPKLLEPADWSQSSFEQIHRQDFYQAHRSQ